MDTKHSWMDGVYECLDSTLFMALSTVQGGQSWTCPLLFAYDQDLTLYVISKPVDQHTKNLIEDPNVSVAIFATNQDLFERVHGLQITGRATIVEDQDVDKIFPIYYKRNPRNPKTSKISPDDYKGDNCEWKFIKIKPVEAFYFNSQLFGHQRKRI